MTLGDRLRALAEATRPPFPLAELHCHVEGTASPVLAREQARRYRIDIDDLLDGERYRWSDFGSFLQAYDRIAALFRSEDDYRRLAASYLGGIGRAGALYGELFVSPDHASRAGLDPAAYVRALASGAAEAEAETGIVARLVVVGIRHLGPDAVEAAARFAARSPHPDITGFGLAGDERVGRPADFARAFAIAGGAGLGLTAHAGEFAGPDAIAETLDALKVSRLGHGVRAIEDEGLTARLRDVRITLELCPSSNVALGLHPSPADHPLRRLRDAGLRVTVSSDDPPFFGTSLGEEYAFAERQGFTEPERLTLTRTAIEAAFVDEATRQRLLERLAGIAISLGAPGVSD